MKWLTQWFGSKKQRIIWTEVQIALYERQMAAAKAIGEKWCLHPSRRVERPATALYERSEVIRAAAPSRKALRLVK